jgi:hypothetical protein
MPGPVGPASMVPGPAGPQGPPGIAGSGLTYGQTWAPTVSYNLSTIVMWNGTSYLNLLANNVGHQPDTSPAQWSAQPIYLYLFP